MQNTCARTLRPRPPARSAPSRAPPPTRSAPSGAATATRPLRGQRPRPEDAAHLATLVQSLISPGLFTLLKRGAIDKPCERQQRFLPVKPGIPSIHVALLPGPLRGEANPAHPRRNLRLGSCGRPAWLADPHWHQGGWDSGNLQRLWGPPGPARPWGNQFQLTRLQPRGPRRRYRAGPRGERGGLWSGKVSRLWGGWGRGGSTGGGVPGGDPGQRWRRGQTRPGAPCVHCGG